MPISSIRGFLENKYLQKKGPNKSYGQTIHPSQQIFVANWKSNFSWGLILLWKKKDRTNICSGIQIRNFCCRKDTFFKFIYRIVYVYIHKYLYVISFFSSDSDRLCSTSQFFGYSCYWYHIASIMELPTTTTTTTTTFIACIEQRIHV